MRLVAKPASGLDWDDIMLIDCSLNINGSVLHYYRLPGVDLSINFDFIILDYRDLNDFEELEIVLKHLSKENFIPEGIVISDFDFLSGADLQLFIDFRMSFPGFKLYFRIDEPNTSNIQALMALNLGFDGLICSETILANPEFISSLEHYINSSKNLNAKNKAKLASLRNHIDDIDKHIIGLLARRLELVNSLVGIKSGSQIPIIQPERWNEILNDAIKEGQKKDLSETFIREIFNAIHIESIKKHLDAGA